MGPIVDRTKERLVATDAGIIKARQKLRKAVLALAEEGTAPPGRQPRAPAGALGRDRAAERPVLRRGHRGRRWSPGRA